MAKKQKELTTEEKWRELSTDIKEVSTPEGFSKLLKLYKELTSEKEVYDEYPILQKKTCEKILLKQCKTLKGKKALKAQMKEYKKDSKFSSFPVFYYARHLNSLTFFSIALKSGNYNPSDMHNVVKTMRNNGSLGLGNPAYANERYQKVAIAIAEADGKTINETKLGKEDFDKKLKPEAKSKSKYITELENIEKELAALNKQKKPNALNKPKEKAATNSRSLQ